MYLKHTTPEPDGWVTWMLPYGTEWKVLNGTWYGCWYLAELVQHRAPTVLPW